MPDSENSDVPTDSATEPVSDSAATGDDSPAAEEAQPEELLKEEVLKHGPEEIVERAPKEVLQAVRNEMLEHVPPPVLDHLRKEVIEQLPERVIDQVRAEVLDSLMKTVPKEVLEKVPKEVLDHLPDMVLSNVSEEAVNGLPREALKHARKEAIAQTLAQYELLQDAPAETKEPMAEDALERVPGEAPELPGETVESAEQGAVAAKALMDYLPEETLQHIREEVLGEVPEEVRDHVRQEVLDYVPEEVLEHAAQEVVEGAEKASRLEAAERAGTASDGQLMSFGVLAFALAAVLFALGLFFTGWYNDDSSDHAK